MNLVGRNMLWLLISQVATWAMSLVVVVMVPRLLGPELLGTYSFANVYVGFFALAAGLGTSIFLTREIARDPSILGRYVYNAVGLKLVLGALLSALALGLGFLLGFADQTMTLVAISCVGMLFIGLLNEVTISTLSGLQRMGRFSIALVISVYVASIGGIVVLVRGGGVVAYALVVMLSAAIPLLVTSAVVWPMVRPQDRHLDLDVWRHLIQAGAPLMVLSVFNQINNTIDVPLLAAIADNTTVGYFGLAYRWAGIPIFIANAVTGSHYPEMSILGKTGGPRFVELVNRALKITLLASIPAAVGLAVVGPDLLEFLYHGEFESSVRPLQILALQIPITGMDTVLATALIASDQLRRYLGVAGAAAVIHPLLCIVLINLTIDAYDNGATGAALATAATEIFVLVGALHLCSPGVMDRRMISWTLRCTLASFAIVVVGVVAGDMHVLVQIVLGAIAFGLAVLALRVVQPAVVRQAIGQVRRFAGGVRSGAGREHPD